MCAIDGAKKTFQNTRSGKIVSRLPEQEWTDVRDACWKLAERRKVPEGRKDRDGPCINVITRGLITFRCLAFLFITRIRRPHLDPRSL